MESSYLIVLCTVPNAEEGARIGRVLVEEKLAACVNIVGGLRSIYYWQGAVCDDAEALLLLKTRPSALEALTRRIVSLHPYQTPEVIALPIVAGHGPYLSWIDESLDRGEEGSGS